jgi:hypothetical protein
MNSVSISHFPATTVARVLLPFGLGYFLSFLYRTVNTVLAPEIVSSTGMGAVDLGLITSAYFVTFAAFQIPLGVLLDRYGPRRVEAALLLVAAAGAIIFSHGESALTLAFSRGLIGVGVSSCLMAAMKANVQWWPAERLALANGTILAMGGLGAVMATAAVQAALIYTNWRSIFAILSLATLFVAATIVLIVPRVAVRPTGEGWGEAFRGGFRVFAEPAFVRVAPLATLAQACFLSYHGLWAAAWLRDVKTLDRVHGRVRGGCAMAGSQTNREAILSSDTTDCLRDQSRRKLRLIWIRHSRDLNNQIEQDHRAVTRRVRPMLGFFKAMDSARVVLGGTAMVHMRSKGQARCARNRHLSLAEQLDRLAA